MPQPDHGVTTVFITLPNTKIELLEPLGEASPIAKFLERNPDGGMHHLCYEVDDIRAARDALKPPARGCSATASRRPAPTASRCCSCTPRISPAPGRTGAGLRCLSTTGIAIFFLIWWLALFAVLPWGIRSQHEEGEITPGTDPGAPAAAKAAAYAGLDDAGLNRGLCRLLCHLRRATDYDGRVYEDSRTAI